MTVGNPFFSIIIPIYNAQDYLRKCLESLLSQKYQDYELICVDDGSTDNSIYIIKEYATKTDKIKILEQNDNAGTARNLGMNFAAGQYLLFLDSDDFFDCTLLEKIHNRIVECEPDIVLFDGKSYDQKTGKFSSKIRFLNLKLVPKKLVFSASDIPRDIFQITNPAPWTKCFKKEFIKNLNIEFQSLPNSNDLFFDYAALSSAERITCIDDSLVFYRTNIGSSIQDKKKKSPLCFLNALQELQNFLIKRQSFSTFRLSFDHEVLSQIRFNLETNALQTVKRIILCSILNEYSFALDALDASIDNFRDDLTLSHANFIRVALKQLNLEYKIENVSVNAKMIKNSDVKDDPTLSVVIVVYNCANSAKETIDSILNQTYSSFELICIDDGSTDNSLEILLGLSSRDSRLAVFHQEKSGTAVALNNGKATARGKYILFANCSATYKNNAFESLINLANLDSLDLLLFNSRSCSDSEYLENDDMSDRDRFLNFFANQYSMSGISTLVNLYGSFKSIPSQFSYLMSSSISNSALFVPEIAHEHLPFSFELMTKAQRVGYLNASILTKVSNYQNITSENFYNCYSYFICFRKMLLVLQNSDINNDELKQIAFNIVYEVIDNAQKIYYRLPPSEKAGIQALSSDEAPQFQHLIVDPSKIMSEIKSLKRKIRQKNKRINELKSTNATHSTVINKILNRLKKKLVKA